MIKDGVVKKIGFLCYPKVAHSCETVLRLKWSDVKKPSLTYMEDFLSIPRLKKMTSQAFLVS